MPLDAALVGSLVTGAMGLLAQAISKCKCVLRTGGEGPTAFSCGFMDGAIEPTHEEEDDSHNK